MGVFDSHLKAGFWLTAPGGGICVLTSSFQINCVVPKCFCFSLFFFFFFFISLLFFLRTPKKNQKKRAVHITTIHLEGRKGREKKEGLTDIHMYFK